MIALRVLMVSLTCLAAVGVSGQGMSPKYLIDGMFFSEIPEGIAGKSLETAFLKDGDGNRIIMIRNAALDPDACQYALPTDSVADAAKWLSLAENKQDGFFTMVFPLPSRLKIAEGDPMPEFNVTDVDGNVWHNGTVAGRPLVVNFWHTGCGPCKREMPEISAWMDDCPEAAYLAVTFDRADAIRRIVAERGFRYVQVAGDRTLWDAFGISQVPVTVLVGKDGKVKKVTVGTNEQKRADMLAAIKAECAQ